MQGPAVATWGLAVAVPWVRSRALSSYSVGPEILECEQPARLIGAAAAYQGAKNWLP